MSVALLDRVPAPPVVEHGVRPFLDAAEESLARAGEAAVESLRDGELAEAVAGLARMESRAVALRVDQVRVIVNAAEQAAIEATAAQVAQAEEWLVGQATGVGTRSGRGLDAKRLRQAARRMFARIDHDLADRHEAILLGRETRTAEVETFLALHDNGDGSYPGRFRIPSSTATSSDTPWTGSPHPGDSPATAPGTSWSTRPRSATTTAPTSTRPAAPRGVS